MKKQTVWILIILCLVFFCMCCCLAVVGGVALKIAPSFVEGYQTGVGMAEQEDFPVEAFTPPSDAAFEMISVLEEVIIPSVDLRDLGERLSHIVDVPATIPAKEYVLEDQENFWISNSDTNDTFEITASLKYETEHSYFWIENDVEFDADDLRTLAETFESQIYPTNREFFGSEFTPGIDEDVHLYIIYARGLGGNVAGYFSSIDSIPPTLHQYSNAHEAFVFSADATSLGDSYTYSVLAHEFQHMIHWNQDRNETTWLNEGFSELAVVLNGYKPGGFDSIYLMGPDVQLNTWPVDPMNQGVHYGSSFLFVQYFLDRFGEEATRALVHNQADGLLSIDQVLIELDIRDDETKEVLTANDVFIDWTITNSLNDASVDKGQYTYHSYDPMGLKIDLLNPKYNSCEDGEWLEGVVNQYGVDPMILNCSGEYMLEFQGVGEVGVLPVDPIEGEFAFYSNKGDQSDMRLTREFDLSKVSGPIELSYSVWYDLEEEYDYLYLLVSEDGDHWEMVETPSGTDADPVGNNYGWGYNGSSGGWIKEVVDLSEYAGEEIWLRFEYVTDAALNGEGLLLDEFRIDAIGYFSNFESDDGGWQPEGFVRVQNKLAQCFAISVIYENGAQTVIEKYQFWGGKTFIVPVSLNDDFNKISILISGITRYTQQPANYQLRLVKQEK